MFCTNCGGQAGTGAVFCTRCGNKLSVTESTSSPGLTRNSGPRRRPIGVWLIVGFYFLSASWTLLSFVLMQTGAVPLTPSQQAYLANLGLLDYIGSVGISVVTLLGAVFLFALHRAAVTLFIIGLAMNIGMTIAHAVTTDFTDALGNHGLVGIVIAWLIMVGVILYARSLSRQGILS